MTQEENDSPSKTPSEPIIESDESYEASAAIIAQHNAEMIATTI